MRQDLFFRSAVLGAAGCALLALLSSCVAPPAVATASIGPVPAGAARIWFYRDYEPSVSLNDANVALNGTPAGSVNAFGGVIYRDCAGRPLSHQRR
jgi:hypothetical protein